MVAAASGEQLGGGTLQQFEMLARHLQAQIDELRASDESLRRDLEAMRNHSAVVEKRSALQSKEFADRLDALAQAVPAFRRASSFDANEDAEEAAGLILANGSEMSGAVARAARVYCEGPLLDAVQKARIFSDSKTFVDMPLKEDPEVVLEAFAVLPKEDQEEPEKLRAFVDKWFEEAGSDTLEWTPPDCIEEPPRLMGIGDPELRSWGLQINKLWSTLGRTQSPDVKQNPQRHSFIPRTFPMVVPGGRFREMYYWDTYWIVRGLLICEMKDTARGLVQSMLDTVQELGFFPNGGRIYYLDRSQPPMLTAMVRAIHEAEPDETWLSKALPVLEKEYRFWMDPKGGRLVQLPRFRGERQFLNIYRSVRNSPRPESYVEDTETIREAENLGRPAAEVYQALCSGAESGWDYSTRWLEDATGRVPLGTANLGTIDTCHVIPADLNSILYDVELTLANFHEELHGEKSSEAESYRKAAELRAATMASWLWSGDAYRDYRLDCSAHSAVVAVSDWAVPLWAGLHGPDGNCAANMVASLKRSGVLRLCGCATTAVDSCGRTQWDAPNAWPPMMLMLIEGLDRVPEASALADCLSDTWLRSNFIAWQRTGCMHEKYDVFEPGRFGAGGEYEPQVGFGWTNGVVLALLVRESRLAAEGPSDQPQSPRFASMRSRGSFTKVTPFQSSADLSQI
eukprot:TRINITY_DN32344_c0_g1_i1.p1 TRINITY_DN32344_c0_g1~~TRINITY_DN32344_c0_g1_i1.p1  ORF type:complete len:708 (+),score=151.23 TRINITY_DN32344_c0_g1_i1:75-2126(+)